MRIAKIKHTFKREGKNIGKPYILVIMGTDKAKHMTAKEIYTEIKKFPCKLVHFTGRIDALKDQLFLLSIICQLDKYYIELDVTGKIMPDLDLRNRVYWNVLFDINDETYLDSKSYFKRLVQDVSYIFDVNKLDDVNKISEFILQNSLNPSQIYINDNCFLIKPKASESVELLCLDRGYTLNRSVF